MKLVYGVHIMWYEIEMIEEHFESLLQATKYTNLPVEIIVCANLQTYIEEPTDNKVFDEFLTRLNTALKPFTSFHIYTKTSDQPFYNIGDFRRELKNEDGYVVWGEIDCLIPGHYFGMLEVMGETEEFNHPHIVSLASRKMWDISWTVVEHSDLQSRSLSTLNAPFKHDDYITQKELDDFNDKFSPTSAQLPAIKIDGALLALRNGLPQLIPNNMHFAREDYIAQCALSKLGYPQYHLINVLKGHNYAHPNKRTRTKSSRTDDIYKKYEFESFQAGKLFIHEMEVI